MMKRILVTFLLAVTIGAFGQPNVVQVEYFLDSDNGYGANTVLDISTPDVDIVEAVMADIPASTAIGYHKLYIRTKDDLGRWSQTTRKNIEIFAPVIANNVVMGEYFIDVDPEFGAGNTFSIDIEQEDIEQAYSAQILANTTLGYHKLYGRVKDSYGNWSHTFRKNIEVYLNPITNVVEIEYFFDDDLEFGNNSIVNIDVPEMDGTWNFDVPYPEGNYDFNDVLFVRVKDSNNHWSITTILDEIASLGLSDSVLNSVSVSPNPFRDTIAITVTDTLEIQDIEVYDILGKKVYQSMGDLRQLDLSALENGTYILRLKTDNESATFKIIKH